MSEIPSLIEALGALEWWRSFPAEEELVRKGPAVVEALGAALEQGAPPLQVAAARTLVRIGRPAIARLHATAQFGSPVARVIAVRALGLIGDPATAAPLSAAVVDADEEVRAAALAGLSGQREDAILHLWRVVVGPNSEARRAAAEALAAVSNCRSVVEAVRAASNGVASATGGASFRPERLLEVLSLGASLGGSDRTQWRQAALALARLTRDGPAELIDTAGPLLLSPVLTAIRGADPVTQASLASVLARIPNGRAIGRLCRMLSEGETEARQGAAEALVLIGEAAVPEVCELLRVLYNDTYRRAAEVLVRIGPPAVPHLAVQLERPHHRVNSVAMDVLARLGAAGAPPLCRVLVREDLELREKAVECLVRIGAAAAASLVPLLAASSGLVRTSAAEVLAKVGGTECIRPLCRALEDSHAATRRHAAIALGQIAEREPAPMLCAALPILQRHLGPWSGESAEARIAYQTAQKRITTATRAFKDIPLPAESAPRHSGDLPRAVNG